MTNEELVTLIQKGVDVSENMEQLYRQNERIIYKWAKPFSLSAEMDDLMQEAYFGLHTAVQKYDESFQCLFLTYAAFYIRVQLQRYVMNCEGTKRLPVHIHERIRKYKRFLREYQQKNEKQPSDSEIIQNLGISPESLEELRIIIFQSQCISLDSLVSSDSDNQTTFGELLSDGSDIEAATIESVDKAAAKKRLWELVDTLCESQRNVIRGIYIENKSEPRIAEERKVSVSRIGQIENIAIHHLRRMSEMRKIAAVYDYDSNISYRGTVGSFNNNGSSTVEYIALKRIEQEEKEEREINDILEQLMKVV